VGDTPSQRLAELRRRGFRPSRHRGQNFLFDRGLLEGFVEESGVAPGNLVLEIGTGPGTLTESLLDAGAVVVTVEIDSLLAEIAKERGEGVPYLAALVRQQQGT